MWADYPGFSLFIDIRQPLSVVPLHVSHFGGNLRTLCSHQTLIYDAPLTSVCSNQDPLEKSCRFNVVCARCSNGGDCVPDNVAIDDETVPGCRTIPTGVHTSSTGITLADFNLKKGYYRDSNASPLILECYQPSACTGGTDATDYCAPGYKGPCKLRRRTDNTPSHPTFHTSNPTGSRTPEMYHLHVPLFSFFGSCPLP